jgi:hypothetical protein
VTGH